MAAKKTQSQMWQEFGAFIRGEDVAKYMGKATGAKEAVAKAVAAREKALRERFDPSYRPTRINPGAKPAKKIDVLGRSPVAPKIDVLGRSPVAPRPTSISGEGRRYAPRKTNDAIPNSLKRKTK